MTRPLSAEDIGKLLHDLGYKGDLIDEDVVRSAASGLRFLIYSFGDSIQFRCGISLETGNRGHWLEFANDYNTDTRFAKAYLEEGDDLVIEADWWLDAEDADHVGRFRQYMDFWELALASLKERIRKSFPLDADAEANADEGVA